MLMLSTPAILFNELLIPVETAGIQEGRGVRLLVISDIRISVIPKRSIWKN